MEEVKKCLYYLKVKNYVRTSFQAIFVEKNCNDLSSLIGNRQTNIIWIKVYLYDLYDDTYKL
jgi:hypothetical protein